MTAPVGCAVLYWSEGALGLGRIVAEEKQRLRVERPRGTDERITGGRIALIVERPSTAPAAGDRDALRALDTAIRAAAARVDVALLWSLVRETAEGVDAGVDLDALGPLAVDDVSSGVACAATLIAIGDERLHFERRGERWLARAPETVETLCAERRRLERRARETDELYLRLAEAVRGASSGVPETETAARSVAALRALAIDEEALQGAPRREALEALKASGQRHERPGEGAFRLLRALGVFDDDDVNLEIERFAIRVEFPDDVPQALERIGPHGTDAPSSADRVDLRRLPTVSIDGSRTLEIDDALSIERLDEQRPWIWIHIADPCAFLVPGDPIDLAALERGLSHYMPDLRVPMLPPQLSQDVASLVEGHARPALSFAVRLDPDGCVSESRIVRSVIRCDARLSYASADARLAADREPDELAPLLGALARFADARRDARIRDGALLLQVPDVDLHVDDAGTVDLERLDADSPSRAIVGEAMVLAGTLAATACRDAGAPALYRRQLPPSGQTPLGVVSGALDIHRCRRSLRRAEVSLEPGRHASLGVDAYCQITSPLRRYADLAGHRQLLGLIGRGQPTYDDQALRRIAAMTGDAERAARRAEGASRDYWRLRWLEQRGDRPLAATVVEGAPRFRVVLDALQSTHAWPGAASLEPGESVELRVARVNPRAGIVRFDHAG